MNRELRIRNKKFRIKSIIRNSLFIIRKSEGFTLIELLLVVSIILVIGTFSVIFFSRFLTQNAVSNTQDQLIGQLRKAQIYAMMGRQNDNWGMNYSSNTITLYLGNSFASRTQAFDEKFSVNSNTSITSSTGILDWNFTRVTGLASNTPATITISGGGTIKKKTVKSQGGESR